MKNCPHCDGEIRDSVIRCNHCGLDPRAPAGTVAPPPAAAAPDPIAPGVAAPSIPASAQFTPAVAPVPAIPPPPLPQPSAVDQPQYFAMKTDLTPPGVSRQTYGSSSTAHPDPAGSAFAGGILGLVGAAIAATGMFLVPLLTAAWGGTVDMGAAGGGPQEIPHEEVGLKFAQMDGLAKTLLMIATVGAVVFAVMVLSNPDMKSVGRLLGQGIVMTGTSVWIFTQLPGLRQDLTDAFHLVLSMASSQVPDDTSQQFLDQAAGLLTIKTGMGIWLIILGSLIVLGGSIMGALALKKAQPSSGI